MPARRRRPKSATTRRRREAFAQAAKLGEIEPVEQVLHDQHGWPVIQPGQVFVTRAGTTFHTGWCSTVVNVADDQPVRLIVVERHTVGGRTQCRDCLRGDYVR